jgi:hypothetical protein
MNSLIWMILVWKKERITSVPVNLKKQKAQPMTSPISPWDDTENLELDEDLEMDSLSLEDGDDFSTEDTDELTESLSIDDGLGDVDLSAQEDAIDLSSEEEMGEAGFEGMEDDLEPLDLDSPEMDLSLDDDLSLDLDAEEEPALALSSGDDSLDYSVEEPDVDPLSLNNIPEPEPKEPVQSVAPTEVKKVSDDMSPQRKDLRCSDDRLFGDGFLYPCEPPFVTFYRRGSHSARSL